MDSMTSRQRVVTALAHSEPDRVPFDCTFSYEAYARLEKYLGYSPAPEVQPRSPALNVTPPVAFLQELNVDLYYLGLRNWKNASAFEYGMDTYTDIWGVGYRKIENTAGLEYPYAFHPLAHASLADLETYPWPDPDDPALVAGLKEEAGVLYENTEFALIGKFNTPLFEQMLALRGMQQLFIDMTQHPEFVEALLDRLTTLAIRLIEVGLHACGSYLQILRLAGDDMGHQRGPLLSPRMFRRQIKPYFSRLYREAKRLFHQYNPHGKLMAHTDGDVYPLIPDYIEMGLDVLNPVQPYVAEMDHSRLKREFGAQLAFHGGIDIQRVLPFGTPKEVCDEAVRVMYSLGPNGGYILAPTHYLLSDVPAENIMALRDGVLQYGHYPLK